MNLNIFLCHQKPTFYQFVNIAGVLLLLLLVSVLKAGTSFANVDDDRVLVKVRRLDFEGVEAVSKNDLTESLACKVPSFWEFWEPLPEIRILDLKQDLLRIKQYYQAQGYYQATAEYELTLLNPQTDPVKPTDTGKISEQSPKSPPKHQPKPPPKSPPDKRKAPESNQIPKYDILFKINEGLPVILRDISINCQCEMETVSSNLIRETLELKPGKIFETKIYDQSKLLIRKLLGNRGYPFAGVQGSATVDLNDNSANVTFDIDLGKLYRFGDIRISGHEDYVREEVVRRAITVKGGERFSRKRIDESRRNLFDLNIFKTAVIKMGDPETEKDTVPIDIQVKSRKQRSVKFGVGYGTDDGLRIQAGWSYRNLTGRADRLTLRARRSDIVENIYAEYLLPYFLSAQNNLISTAGYEKEEKDYYTLQRTSVEVDFYRKLEGNWFSSIGYNLENNRPENVNVEDAEGEVDPRDTESFLVSSVKFGIEHSTVDDVLNSRKGTVVSLSIENASGYLGSEINYIRPGVEAKVYFPMPWGIVLAGRMDFRTIRESGDTDYIPISKQFFLGGSKSVRGYGFEKLGVIDKKDVIEDVSGLSSFISSIELRFPVYDNLGGVVFLDTGALDQDSFRVDLNSLRYTCGLGVRYKTIIGPIQFDFGYQLNPAKSTATDDASLTGLLNKDRWYLHFNVGQTF
ncbi:MAG: BamA/TamA family outer membrane protein [Desulfobacteraceae bacterium]|nr:BamA/TamA family outer membrane protein [Desulfobacteraceae bacterium]